MKYFLISKLSFLYTPFLVLSCLSCSNNSNGNEESEEVSEIEGIVNVDPSLFLSEGLVEPITTEEKTLSDGTVALCYKIVTNTTPSDHTMGPWCPTNIADGADKGGKWFENGELYDVDGAFIENLDEFYSDSTWKMYDENGDIYTTDSQEACEAAANPNVGEEYANYCVYCQHSYFDDITVTYYIPVTPVKLDAPDFIGGALAGPPDGGGPPDGQAPPNGGAPAGMESSVIGTAFNGVNFDPPAPTAQILGAYTIAPMDDNGGHINPATGYHYHAATGTTTVVAQSDGHAGMIGYAMDGFGIHEQMNEDGAEPTDLDDCRGHTDDIRGYHYHVAAPGTNSFINCFNGAQGIYELN